jgi:hypothetical protein
MPARKSPARRPTSTTRTDRATLIQRDAHWKDNPRDNEANNKRTYDMNYRRKVNEFSSQLRKESGKS